MVAVRKPETPEDGVAEFYINSARGREYQQRILDAAEGDKMAVVSDICKEHNVRCLRLIMSKRGGTTLVYKPYDAKLS